MAYSLWELLQFTREELRKREQTMTFEEREAERLEALRKVEASNGTKGEEKHELPK